MNRLKELRDEKGKSLKEVSEELNIPYQTYRNYEVSKRDPKLEVWQKLAEYFGVSVPYIMGVSNERKEISEEIGKRIKNQLSSLFDDPEKSKELMKNSHLNTVNSYAEFITNLVSSDDQEYSVAVYTVFVDTLNSIKYLSENKDLEDLREMGNAFRILGSIYKKQIFHDYSETFTDPPVKPAKETIENYFSSKEKLNALIDKQFLNVFNEKYD